MEKGIAQLNFNGKKAEIISANQIIFIVEQDGNIRKIENKKLKDSSKEELEAALSKTKERLKFNLSADVIEIIRKAMGDFTIGF